MTILRGDTSLDLTGRAFGMDFAAEAELRQIYLKARYLSLIHIWLGARNQPRNRG